MEINFECKKCGRIFNCDVGTVTFAEDSERPVFERNILCPNCGPRSMDGVYLTELGQSQLTEGTLDFEGDDLFDHFEWECQGCGLFLPIDNVGLCGQCAAKLDRDLIRQRDWDYSTAAFGVDPSKREELRRQVIAQYGEKLELIAPFEAKRKNRVQKQRKQRVKRKNR